MLGLSRLHQADVRQELREEPGVDQVQAGVLNAADVLVHGHPVVHVRPLEGGLRVVGRAVAVEVPGRAEERVHGVRFPHGGRAALRAGRGQPLRHVQQRRAPHVPHLDVLDRKSNV